MNRKEFARASQALEQLQSALQNLSREAEDGGAATETGGAGQDK